MVVKVPEKKSTKAVILPLSGECCHASPNLGVVQNCHHVHKGTLEGRGSRSARHFSKMSFLVHCDFEKGYQNQHFQSTILLRKERVKKELSVYTLDNVDNSEQPLIGSVFYVQK